jgi:hypothetical protein
MGSKLFALAASISIDWHKLRFCRRPRDIWAEAQAAVHILLTKQLQDLESFNIRTSLHLSVLDEARRSSVDKTLVQKRNLPATTNMVSAFLASANLYRIKWSDQVARLKDRYPVTEERLAESGLQELELLQQQLCTAEKRLEQALQAV